MPSKTRVVFIQDLGWILGSNPERSSFICCSFFFSFFFKGKKMSTGFPLMLCLFYLNCISSFPIWSLGQDVAFDCFGFWSLPIHILYIHKAKKICVFQVSRPYLGFCPDPKHFIVSCKHNIFEYGKNGGKYSEKCNFYIKYFAKKKKKW